MQKGIATNQPFEGVLEQGRFTAERNTIFLEESSNKQFGIINWKYEFPGWSDWDERAMPLLNAFLNENSDPSEKDIDEFMLVLQNKDLGWLKREGIKKRIHEYQKAILRQQYRVQGRCEHCGGKFKGLFKKTCSICGSPKSY